MRSGPGGVERSYLRVDPEGLPVLSDAGQVVFLGGASIDAAVLDRRGAQRRFAGIGAVVDDDVLNPSA